MDTGEVIYEKVFASLRPPPKISLKHDWMKELGSEVARPPEGEVVNQAKQIQTQIIIERRDPLFAVMQITSAQSLFSLSKRLIHVSLVKVRT